MNYPYTLLRLRRFCVGAIHESPIFEIELIFVIFEETKDNFFGIRFTQLMASLKG